MAIFCYDREGKKYFDCQEPLIRKTNNKREDSIVEPLLFCIAQEAFL